MNSQYFTRVVLMSLCVAFLGYGPAQAQQQYPESVGRLVAETKKSIKTVTLEEFRAVLDSKRYDMIIDVREPDEYAQGHVPGAINIPRGTIEFRIWKHVGFPENTDTGKKIFLYCASGSRCALAAKSLQDLGFSDVTAVDMQFSYWDVGGHPLEK